MTTDAFMATLEEERAQRILAKLAALQDGMARLHELVDGIPARVGTKAVQVSAGIEAVTALYNAGGKDGE